MATRVITSTILKPSGAAWKGAIVRFQPLDDAFTVSPDATFPEAVIEAVTNDSGVMTVTLESGLTVGYRCTLPDRSEFEFLVPAGSATTLELLRAAMTGVPVPGTAPLIGP